MSAGFFVEPGVPYVLTRDVREEAPYVPLGAGVESVIYKCTRATYGCCGWDEVAMTLDPEGGYPFFGVPEDALKRAPARVEL